MKRAFYRQMDDRIRRSIINREEEKESPMLTRTNIFGSVFISILRCVPPRYQQLSMVQPTGCEGRDMNE